MEETQSVDPLVAEGERRLGEGDKGQALEQFKQAILVEPKSESAWFGLAKATDDEDEAIRAFGQVIALNPDNIEARNQLIALQVGNLREGLEANERAYQENPLPRFLIPMLLALDVLVYGILALLGGHRAFDWFR